MMSGCVGADFRVTPVFGFGGSGRMGDDEEWWRTRPGVDLGIAHMDSWVDGGLEGRG
jgi:hypothetical protein